MLYILYGEDDFSRQQALTQIRQGIGTEDVLAANTSVLEGQQLTVDQLRAVSETVPFLAEKRLVIVNGLLGRYEPPRRGAPRRKKKDAAASGEDNALAERLTQVPEFTVVVLADGGISERNPLLRKIADKATVRVFPLVKGARLTQWVRERVSRAGGSIAPGALDLLAKLVGSNLWTMANEIDKLLLFTEGRQIEQEDVAAVVSAAQETSVFNMVDAILESRAGAAQLLLQRMLQQGASPAYLLVMLTRQLGIIVRVREMVLQRKPRGEIQARLGLANDYVLRKALEQAERYSLARLREVYHRLLEADLAIKTGKMDGELALSLLTAQMGTGNAARACAGGDGGRPR
ncbi:MAG: DNA polymerase III subunit delta [Chloroflexota bacterium]